MADKADPFRHPVWRLPNLHRMTETPTPIAGTTQYLQAIRERVATIVVGQDVVVERMLIALLTSGHLLLEGMPGLA